MPHHLNQQKGDVRHRVQQAAAVVETAAEIFRQRVHAHAAVQRQKEIAQHHESKDSAELEIGLGKALLQTGPHHADHVVRADIGAEDRAGHGPPGDAPPGQEVIARSLLAPAHVHAVGTDGQHAADQHDHIKRFKGQLTGLRQQYWRHGNSDCVRCETDAGIARESAVRQYIGGACRHRAAAAQPGAWSADGGKCASDGGARSTGKYNCGLLPCPTYVTIAAPTPRMRGSLPPMPGPR